MAMTTTRHQYTVRRSDRAQRARLTVSEAGEAVVVLPRRAPLREAAMLVEQHADWLDRHIARVRRERAALAERPGLGEGRMLMIADVSYRIWAVDPGSARPSRGCVDEHPGQLEVRVGRDGRDASELLAAWLRQRAYAKITERVQDRAAEMGVKPGRITIRDQSSRWASASRSGALSFSWRLILAPPYVLDAVVVHELAHLRSRGHSKAFWSLVERHAPRTSEARRWLREHSREARGALD